MPLHEPNAPHLENGGDVVLAVEDGVAEERGVESLINQLLRGPLVLLIQVHPIHLEMQAAGLCALQGGRGLVFALCSRTKGDRKGCRWLVFALCTQCKRGAGLQYLCYGVPYIYTRARAVLSGRAVIQQQSLLNDSCCA